jgi:hypothetical protein
MAILAAKIGAILRYELHRNLDSPSSGVFEEPDRSRVTPRHALRTS